MKPKSRNIKSAANIFAASITVCLAASMTEARSPADQATPAASTPAAPSAGAAGAKADCATILAGDHPIGPYKAADLCPAINSLKDLFVSANKNNYAPTVAYSKPSDEFFAGLAGSMKHYKGDTITVPVGGTQAITLAGLDTLDEAGAYKRNKLGLILERIRTGDGKHRHVGKVCVSYAQAAAGESPYEWVGSLFLKYGLPALIKLLAGDPSKVIDRYDAMVLVERGSPDARTNPIRTINFVRRGSLPTDCKKDPASPPAA